MDMVYNQQNKTRQTNKPFVTTRKMNEKLWNGFLRIKNFLTWKCFFTVTFIYFMPDKYDINFKIMTSNIIVVVVVYHNHSHYEFEWKFLTL